MTEVFLTSSLTEQQAGELLRQGGVVVFGDQFLDVATGLLKEIPGTPILAGHRVADLKLPDTLMAYATMVFAHTLPGGNGRPGTDADLAAWKQTLFDRVDFVAGDEPMPNAEFSLTAGTRDVVTMLTWAPPGSEAWNGVRSGQLRRIAAQFEARHDRAVTGGSKDTMASAPSGWHRFEHPDGLFNISYPTRWSERHIPGSGAALSCVSSDGSEMLEVLVMKASGPRRGDEVAQIAADGVEKDLGSRRGGRVVHRRVTASGPLGGCLSLMTKYIEGGQNFTTEYFLVGAGRNALYVALKCPSERFAANKPDFDKACVSLSTPWLDGTGHGGIGQSKQRNSAATPAMPTSAASPRQKTPAEKLVQRDAERIAAKAPEAGGCRIVLVLVLAAVLCAAIWYFAV